MGIGVIMAKDINKIEVILSRILFFLEPRTVVQIWRFTIGGAAATAIDFSAYVALTRLLGLNFLIANVIAMTLGATFLFFFNKRYTFRDTEKKVVRQYVVFWLNAMFMLALVEGILLIGVNLLKINDLVVKIAAYAITYVVNFLIQKYLIFRKQAN